MRRLTQPNRTIANPAGVSRRGGAALIIVLAMTGMLMFLGFFFFSYISAERNSAAWFALSANQEVAEGDYFDFALAQVIIGPPDDLKNSALYGRKWSMLPNMLGTFGPDLKPTDLHPYTGRGIHVRYDGDSTGSGIPLSENFHFDYNGDGTASGETATPADRRIINFSPTANPVDDGGNFVPFTPLAQERHPDYIPDFEPDAGYTYPDINSMFLGHFALVPDPTFSPGNADYLKRVWIPSFHRPQYLPRAATADLYTNTAYRNRLLRPHQQSRVELRRYDTGSSSVQRTYPRRYVGINGFNTTFTNATAGPVREIDFTTPADEGIWHNVANHASISYDADADGIIANGDEAILLDLDHRVEVMSDGSRRIPMFYITIMDADGLLNINAAGNLYGEDNSLVHGRTSGSGPDDLAFGDGRFVTQSNLGLSAGEVNLGRALYRALDTSFSAGTNTVPDPAFLYDEMFGFTTGTAQVTQNDMSNMEVARILLGVADGNAGTSTELVAGRWGELDRLDAAVAAGNPPAPAFPRETWSAPLFPAPGQVQFDDNDNFLSGGGKAALVGTSSEDSVFGPLGIAIPSGVHPIDMTGAAVNYFSGTGESNAFATKDINEAIVVNQSAYTTHSGTPFGKLRSGRQLDPTNPARWPSYSNRWELQVLPATVNAMKNATGVQPWFQGTRTAGTLQATQSNGAFNRFLADEPDESVIENALRDLTNDALFSIAEMSFLQMNDADYTSSAVDSRLEDLVEFNFNRGHDYGTTADFNEGWWLRSQFTTDSYDRWEFAMAPAIGTDLADNSTDRFWEFNELSNDATRLVFPPEFDGARRFTQNDPFREAVRQWLTVELGRDENFRNFPLPQRRLNINRILEKDERGNFVERHLTPHPVFEATDNDSQGILDLMYASGTSVAANYDTEPANLSFANIGNNKFVREWWAKYDRQRLARDIYVLLYTIGNGDHTEDVTGDNSSFAIYTEEQCREMAQFAVNYVDALDRDGVITEFVYDVNLGNGWSITGEKTATGTFVESEANSVFGVEAQSLTINEGLWITSQEDTSTDHDVTPFDDQDGNRHFLYLELLNGSPFDVELEHGTWRIRRVDIDTSASPETRTDVAGFRITDNVATNFTTGTGELDTANIVEPGRLYTIGHHDGSWLVDTTSDVHSSDFRVEHTTGSGQYQVLAPKKWAEWRHNTTPVVEPPEADTDPWVDLDLSWDGAGEEARSKPQDASGDDVTGARTPGYLLNETNQPTAGLVMAYVLERRLNPTLSNNNTSNANALDNGNAWVTVDEFRIDGSKQFDPSAATPNYSALVSQERRQPLAADAPQDYNDGATGETGNSYNSLRDINSRVPDVNGNDTFTLWQPHFDRDYVGVFELMSLPLFGPADLRDDLAEGGSLSGLNTAMTKFTIPDPGTPGVVDDDNAWYRLFEFVEVPTAVQAHLRDELPIPRTPGKVNLNTIRHPGVLAALIDDDFHLDDFRTPAQVASDSEIVKVQYPYLQMNDPEEGTRQWFEQFVYSRDRIDPVSNLPLPGIPGSRPFRPFSYANVLTGNRNAQASVEHTLLRSLPYNGTVGAMTENTNSFATPGTNWTGGTDPLLEGLSRRGLFEARTAADAAFPGTAGVNAVDFHTRLRLLNKLSNNTTVRSHLFFCWIMVHFHEAAEDEYGNAQVGGDLSDPTHPNHDSPSAGINDAKRAFFVIDRSKLEEAYDARTGKFDWRKLVVYRTILQ
ncbi:MAG: hypothetical protein CMJ47_12995 [Planctomyces sp.]|nr:hypothetical protein [Planctomyces sp.]